MMSIYQAADLYITLIDILHRDKQTGKARAKLDYALATFSGTNRAERLKEFDKIISASH